jgi:hypothetical protein
MDYYCCRESIQYNETSLFRKKEEAEQRCERTVIKEARKEVSQTSASVYSQKSRQTDTLVQRRSILAVVNPFLVTFIVTASARGQ